MGLLSAPLLILRRLIECVHIVLKKDRRVWGWVDGVSLGSVFADVITPDCCNLQVDCREKSARFTPPLVSICRYYDGGGGEASTGPGHVGRRYRKQQSTNNRRVMDWRHMAQRTFH